MMKDLETSDLREHSRNIKTELQEIIDHIHRDIEKVDDPKAEALFETSAEVLNGLVKVFTHYENKSEEAWK